MKVSHAGALLAPFDPLLPASLPFTPFAPLLSLCSPSPPLLPLLRFAPFAPLCPLCCLCCGHVCKRGCRRGNGISIEGVTEGASCRHVLSGGKGRGRVRGLSGARRSKGVILGFRFPTTSVGSRGEGAKGSKGEQREVKGARGSEGSEGEGRGVKCILY